MELCKLLVIIETYIVKNFYVCGALLGCVGRDVEELEGYEVFVEPY